VKSIELLALNLLRFRGEKKRFKVIYKDFLDGKPISSHFSENEFALANAELQKARHIGAKVIPYNSVEYPEKLRNIPDPPLILYVIGDTKSFNLPSISIVGSRKCTPYGKNIAYKFAKEFSSYSIPVVSGLALGIDSSAHRGAIDGNGKTIAVIGNGVDRVYPSSNRTLAKVISTSGAVISEFPLGMRPEKYNFPFRNRIISGISIATIVVEAAEKSGSLITARLAAEQGKDVFAVPGNITSKTSKGTNNLLKDGAIPITEVGDVISYIGEFKSLSYTEGQNNLVMNKISSEESNILSVMENSAETIDEISLKTGIKPTRLVSILTYMEINGVIKKVGGRYIKVL
jgi:DNA processing protein